MHVWYLALDAVFERNIHGCREFIKNLEENPKPWSAVFKDTPSKDLDGCKTAYLLVGIRIRREYVNNVGLNQHLRMKKCFINLMNNFTKALCQLKNVPRSVASLSKGEKAENLVFKVMTVSASVGVAEEDLYLLTCTAEMCLGRSHTRTRIDGRIVPYFEKSRRERIMALQNQSVWPVWIQVPIFATFSQLSLSDLQCHARRWLLAVS